MIEPLNDQILVLETTEEQSIDGILLPETSREDTKYGKVVEVGQTTTTIRKGDTIAFGMYAGIPARVEGIPFLLMKEGEVLFRLKEDKSS